MTVLTARKDAPEGTLCTRYGTHYKIGRHGLIFMWIDKAWIRSSKSIDDLLTYTRSTRHRRLK